MKKLITFCLLLTIAFTSQAQEGKPTKEQTVEFIKNFFKDKIIKCDDFRDKTYKSNETKNFSLDFDEANNSLTIYYENYGEYNNISAKYKKNSSAKYKTIIDLSKVESIVFEIHKLGECDDIYLNFKVAANANIAVYKCEETNTLPINPTQEKEVLIPINGYTCNGCDHSNYNQKIFKAFNHLRKLCGAPEPISFD